MVPSLGFFSPLASLAGVVGRGVGLGVVGGGVDGLRLLLLYLKGQQAPRNLHEGKSS